MSQLCNAPTHHEVVRPYRLDGHIPVDAARRLVDADPSGARHRVTVAGRIRARRDMGGVVFSDLEDQTGVIQLIAQDSVGSANVDLAACSLGDWVAASGTVVRSRRGTTSLSTDALTVLAPALRPFPRSDALRNHDVRYRRRYLDLWATPGVRATLMTRSRIISLIRRYMETLAYVEVETPILHHQAGGANARPFVTRHNALNTDLALRVAPELHLKRLVVGGVERVFEIGRVFRNEGISPRHNPEFTMMEAYCAYADYTDMMELTEQLVAHLAEEITGSTRLTYAGLDLDLTPPWPRVTMEEAVQRHSGVHIDPNGPPDLARAAARSLGVDVDSSWSSGRVLAQTFDRLVDRHLTGPVFVIDYPVEVSPLAREHRSRPGVTERFEAFVAGHELANAFSELTDPAVQRERFEDQARQRDDGDDEAMPYDEDYVDALEYGLPPTGGLGIGIDRLVMLLTGATNIREVIAFPTLAPSER